MIHPGNWRGALDAAWELEGGQVMQVTHKCKTLKLQYRSGTSQIYRNRNSGRVLVPTRPGKLGKKQETEHDQEICKKAHKNQASKSRNFACGAPEGRIFVLRSLGWTMTIAF